MKPLTLIFMFALTIVNAGIVFAQCTPHSVSDNIWDDCPNVGIGTVVPIVKLSVQNGNDISSLVQTALSDLGIDPTDAGLLVTSQSTSSSGFSIGTISVAQKNNAAGNAGIFAAAMGDNAGSNTGISGNAEGENTTNGNTGVDGTAVGAGSVNTGVAGIADGDDSESNIGVSGEAGGTSTGNNFGIKGGAQGGVTNMGVYGSANGEGGGVLGVAHIQIAGPLNVVSGVDGGIIVNSGSTVTNAYAMKSFWDNQGTITNGTGLLIGDVDATNDLAIFQEGADDENILKGKLCVGGNFPREMLDVNGKAIIGTNTITSGDHLDFKLSVDGKVVAKEYVATLDNWADFVFSKNYTLSPSVR